MWKSKWWSQGSKKRKDENFLGEKEDSRRGGRKAGCGRNPLGRSGGGGEESVGGLCSLIWATGKKKKNKRKGKVEKIFTSKKKKPRKKKEGIHDLQVWSPQPELLQKGNPHPPNFDASAAGGPK